MGDVNRITKPFHDFEFEKLMRAMDTGKFKCKTSSFFERPVYQYTKAEVGHVSNIR